jgi:signal transduction histidine kinase
MSLIDNILDFSHLESGKLSLAATPFDLRELMTKVTVDLHERAAQKGIQIELLYPDSAPRRFIGDAKQIQQVLTHLADNAVKFTEKGFIRIYCECVFAGDQEASVSVFVKDTGIGIRPEHREFIFQKFSQVDGSLTRRQGGTGLGLTIVKELIELMHGTIGFESSLNAGSCFWFRLTLPVAEAATRSEDVVLNAD